MDTFDKVYNAVLFGSLAVAIVAAIVGACEYRATAPEPDPVVEVAP